MNILTPTIMCPVCGGRIQVLHDDRVNRCEYCGSPVLGPSQSRDCVNHPGRLAKGICHVCGDLLCEDCMEKRVGDYGGKLLTIVNCQKPQCVAESEWAIPLNKEYHRLTNMDWADHIDNVILRITGLGAVLMMIFELLFVLGMLYIQYFTAWGLAGNIPYFFIPGDAMIVLNILGNLLSAIMLQTALQVYVHERQLGSGILLLVFLIVEVLFLLFRGWFFKLNYYPDPLVLQLLIGCFAFATLLVFVGAVLAIRIGFKKHKQFQQARKQLGLQ